MEIFVISLRSARARRTHVIAEMAAAGLRFHFFDAVEAGSEPERHFVATNVPLYEINARRPPLPSEIACYASHRAVWRRCVELGAPIVVLEDDFRLLPGFASALPRLEASHSRVWVRPYSIFAARAPSIHPQGRPQRQRARPSLSRGCAAVHAGLFHRPVGCCGPHRKQRPFDRTRGQVHAAYVGARRTAVRHSATARRYRDGSGAIHDRRPITQELEPLAVDASSFR